MKPKELLDIAASFAWREPKWRGDMLMAAVSVRSDGLFVASRNVQVPAQRTPHGHAEYRLHSKLKKGAVVAVARVTRAGEWANAKPCKGCETVLRNRRVSVIYYTDPDEPEGYGTIIL
mgnify:CR=1 FL=1